MRVLIALVCAFWLLSIPAGAQLVVHPPPATPADDPELNALLSAELNRWDAGSWRYSYVAFEVHEPALSCAFRRL
jgi:hypothetical protein